MKKEQFIAFIDAPAYQQGESVTLLAQLTKQFPYCQTAQLLLAKALHNENSIGYNEQLKVAAAYASDRKVLYQLIMSKGPAAVTEEQKKKSPSVTLAIPQDDSELLNNLVVSSTLETDQPETEIPSLSAEETRNPLIEGAVNFGTAEQEEKQETLAEEIQKAEATETTAEESSTPEKPTIEEITEKHVETRATGYDTGSGEIKKTERDAANEISEPTLTEINERQPETVNVEELPLLEKNIIVEAIDASIELEVGENMPFRETGLAEEEATAKQETAETPVNPAFPEAEEAEEFDPNKTYSFSEWLRLSKKAGAKAGITEKDSEKTDKQEENQPEKTGKEEKQARRKNLDELIDKFISEEPKISRPSAKQDFFSPVNMARQSVQDDNEFVTETLANIYLKQGSYAKAIKAYETLSLKFPEKKLYFAGRIKEIKKIIKEQK